MDEASEGSRGLPKKAVFGEVPLREGAGRSKKPPEGQIHAGLVPTTIHVAVGTAIYPEPPVQPLRSGKDPGWETLVLDEKGMDFTVDPSSIDEVGEIVETVTPRGSYVMVVEKKIVDGQETEVKRWVAYNKKGTKRPRRT